MGSKQVRCPYTVSKLTALSDTAPGGVSVSSYGSNPDTQRQRTLDVSRHANDTSQTRDSAAGASRTLPLAGLLLLRHRVAVQDARDPM